ncbi:MAG: class I SAM-dependent methyltransferase [Actinomycetota bacterium]
MPSPETPKLYRELAKWFHLLTAPEEYVEEAEAYRRLIVETSARPVREVLELGSGGGNNASHLKAHFTMTLTDLSPEMLAVSRKLNPECEHVEGDMRTLRLDRDFDAVFVHDAIDYITTLPDLRAVMETAFLHCRPGGVALFAPDLVRETFESSSEHGGNDGDGRGLRYLEWTWDPDPTDETYYTDFAYLLREEDGSMRVEHDRHVCGLFRRDEWIRLVEEVGFRAKRRVIEREEGKGTEAFVGLRPPASG